MKIVAVVLLSIIPLIQSATNSSDRENEVAPHSVPHQVALYVTQYHSERHFCEGSLISELWVLTSAVCVQFAKSVLVTLGAHDLYKAEKSQQNFTILTYMDLNSKNVIFHPKYDRNTYKNNVALVKLPTPAALNDYVNPLCLVPSNIPIEDGTTVIATGWKKLNSSPTDNSRTLRSVKAPTISNQLCKKSYNISAIPNSMICTSTISGSNNWHQLNQHFGDIGGPLTISGKTVDGIRGARQCQVGIATFVTTAKDSESQMEHPAGFIRVSDVIDDFIRKETGIEPCNECSNYIPDYSLKLLASRSNIISIPSFFVLFIASGFILNLL